MTLSDLQRAQRDEHTDVPAVNAASMLCSPDEPGPLRGGTVGCVPRQERLQRNTFGDIAK